MAGCTVFTTVLEPLVVSIRDCCGSRYKKIHRFHFKGSCLVWNQFQLMPSGVIRKLTSLGKIFSACPNRENLLVQVWNCDCVPVIECCDVECWSAVLCTVLCTVLCANTMPIKPRGISQLVSWGCFIKGCAEACRKMIQLMKSAGIVI